jgi:hypothetical protein
MSHNTSTIRDLVKTEMVIKLLKTPATMRDEGWHQQFLENLVGAGFRGGEPPVVSGPDGYPYMQLFTPLPGVKFDCYTIERLMDDVLLENGLGVVLNPDKPQPDWVLTYGDLVNLKLFGSLLSPSKHAFAPRTYTDEVLQQGTKLIVSRPSVDILPDYLATQLKRFLEHNGIVTPKIGMLAKDQGSKTEIELAFNVTQDNVPTEEHFAAVMNAIGWYLPRHYSYVSIQEVGNEALFSPL